MSRTPRSEIFDADEIGIYHCINRCVRQLHLLRDDQPGGRSGSPRRVWIRARLEELAGIFAFDHLNFSIMDNHLHVLIRNRPDIQDGWADEEVVRRWWQLCPGRRDDDGRPAAMTDDEVQRNLANHDKVLVLRRRLGDISWFMKSLNEYISVRANAEDETKGCFWEGRFKSVRILDDCGLLACAAYIDLNPVRARLAETPETSRFTSVYERLSALQSGLPGTLTQQNGSGGSSDTTQISVHPSILEAAATAHDSRAGWLSPVQLDEASECQMPAPTRRASNTGYLNLSFVE
ncbi:MAG: transposase [Pirellulaceae bacterium]